jgi:hypothetical protein
LTGGFNTTTKPTPSAKASVMPRPGDTGATTWSLNRSFQAGDFTLRIVDYQEGLPALAETGEQVSENGQWILMEISVTNNGAQEGTFVPEQQVLLTDSGEEAVNEPASALAHAEFNLGTTPIKSKQTQTGFLAFDIPLDCKPTALQFVGKLGQNTVTVPLG